MEQMARSEHAGDVEILVPVVIVVPDGHAHSVHHAFIQAGLMGDIREGAVMVVMVEGKPGTPNDRPAGEGSIVQKQDVLPAIAIVVEEGAAGTHGLDQVFVFRLGALMREMDSRRRRYVDKPGDDRLRGGRGSRRAGRG